MEESVTISLNHYEELRRGRADEISNLEKLFVGTVQSYQEDKRRLLELDLKALIQLAKKYAPEAIRKALEEGRVVFVGYAERPTATIDSYSLYIKTPEMVEAEKAAKESKAAAGETEETAIEEAVSLDPPF